MKEKEKMIRGENYDPADPQLVLERYRANRICMRYNRKALNEIHCRHHLLKRLLKTQGRFWIKPPFYCDYGYNIELGKEVVLNYGVTILDVCLVKIGDHTLIGPQVQIYTACHPIDPLQRKAGIEFAKPVTIGRNVWIGGGSIILPGVTIGDHTVIGAGSVVTRSLPDHVVAAGNPCRILRRLEIQECSNG